MLQILQVELQREFKKPTCTRVLFGITISIFLLNELLSKDPTELFTSFGKVNPAINHGEVWRFATAMFLHANLLHVAMNAMALLALGSFIEQAFGGKKLLAVYFAGGIVGFVASYLWWPGLSIGASGGVFALMAAIFVYGVRYRRELPLYLRRRLVTNMMVIILINLMLGVWASKIDNAAHLGGLLAGMCIGTQLNPPYQISILLRRMRDLGV